jgi:hypothetical protein
MNLVIAMDGCVEEYHAPVFPGAPPFFRWSFADPLAEGMTQAEVARSFETVFWQILHRVMPGYAAAPEPVTAVKPDSRGNEVACDI